MLTLKERTARIGLETDEFEDIVIFGSNFVIIDFSGFCYHSGGIELLEEYIAKNGGTVRKSTVKNTDYAIICPVAYTSTANYKKPADDYEKALTLKKAGKAIKIISDLDFYVHFKLFSKLRVDNKLRLAELYLNGDKRFDEKTAAKIQKFIDEKKGTWTYKEYFEKSMKEYTAPLYDK